MTINKINQIPLVIVYALVIGMYAGVLQAQESQEDAVQQQTVTAEPEETTDQQIDADTAQQPESGSDEQQLQEEEREFNVNVLVERMKETKAIGVITKLSLKNQVDDLLEQAEQIKNNNGDVSDEKNQLRENFEGLILKTVTLLNKGEDYALAEDIYLAREELWNSIMENKA